VEEQGQMQRFLNIKLGTSGIDLFGSMELLHAVG